MPQKKIANREPQLNRIGCSQFDLNLFREAQAQAALKDEEDQHLGTGKLQLIQFGKHEYRTWYLAPYPQKLQDCSKLFICHLCLEVSLFYNNLDLKVSQNFEKITVF